MARRSCPVVPTEVRSAFQAAQRRIGRNLDGYCLEASALMWLDLREHGQARAIRYDIGDGEGHWTIEYEGVEYDPTIAFWSIAKGRPRDAAPRCLYVVADDSPHAAWEVTETTDEADVRRVLVEMVEPYR